MKVASTITSKGQITLPLKIRARLGLREGDRVEFLVESGEVKMRPEQLAENPFEKYIGCLPAFETTQQINKWVADLRDDDRPDENGARH